jgi:hypothetical protein
MAQPPGNRVKRNLEERSSRDAARPRSDGEQCCAEVRNLLRPWLVGPRPAARRVTRRWPLSGAGASTVTCRRTPRGPVSATPSPVMNSDPLAASAGRLQLVPHGHRRRRLRRRSPRARRRGRARVRRHHRRGVPRPPPRR